MSSNKRKDDDGHYEKGQPGQKKKKSSPPPPAARRLRPRLGKSSTQGQSSLQGQAGATPALSASNLDPNIDPRLQVPFASIVEQPGEANFPQGTQQPGDPNVPQVIQQPGNLNVPEGNPQPKDPNAPQGRRKSRYPNVPLVHRPANDPTAPLGYQQSGNPNIPQGHQQPNDPNDPLGYQQPTDPNVPLPFRLANDPIAPLGHQQSGNPNVPLGYQQAIHLTQHERLFGTPREAPEEMADPSQRLLEALGPRISPGPTSISALPPHRGQLDQIDSLESLLDSNAVLNSYEVGRVREILKRARQRVRTRRVLFIDPSPSTDMFSLEGKSAASLKVHESTLQALLKSTNLTSTTIDSIIEGALPPYVHETVKFEGPRELNTFFISNEERIWKLPRSDMEELMKSCFNGNAAFAESFIRLLISAERIFHSELPDMLSDTYVIQLHEETLKACLLPVLMSPQELDHIIYELRIFPGKIKQFQGDENRLEKVWRVPRHRLAAILAEKAPCYSSLPAVAREKAVTELLNNIELREQRFHRDWKPRSESPEKPDEGTNNEGSEDAATQAVLRAIARKGWPEASEQTGRRRESRSQRWPPYLQFLQEMGFLPNLLRAKPMTHKEMLVRYRVPGRSAHTLATKYLRRALQAVFAIPDWNEFAKEAFPGIQLRHLGGAEALQMKMPHKYEEVKMLAFEEERVRLGLETPLEELVEELHRSQQRQQLSPFDQPELPIRDPEQHNNEEDPPDDDEDEMDLDE